MQLSGSEYRVCESPRRAKRVRQVIGSLTERLLLASLLDRSLTTVTIGEGNMSFSFDSQAVASKSDKMR
jgi:hypothetical protein